MKSIFLIFLVLACTKADTFCTPGSLLKLNCNTCICSNDGKKAVCTDMSCLQRTKIKKVCEPYSEFKDYCNTCICGQDGSSFFCTKMRCDEKIWNKNGTLKNKIQTHDNVKSVKSYVCKPKSIFKESCNICICSKDGLFKECTMMSCKQEKVNENSIQKVKNRVSKFVSGKVCEPGTLYNIDNCNVCICNENGTRFACTFKICLSNFKQMQEVRKTKKYGRLFKKGNFCVPGKRFYRNCNDCICTSDGKNAYCTLRKCETET